MKRHNTIQYYIHYLKCIRPIPEDINERMTLIGYEKMTVTVRRFEDTDAEEVHNLIIRNFKEVNMDKTEFEQNYFKEPKALIS